MTLSLKNVVHEFPYGSRRNNNGSDLAHEEERTLNSAENYHTTKTVLS